MKTFLLFLLGLVNFTVADNNLRTTVTEKQKCNTTRSECMMDKDCPQILCIGAPCPSSICRENKCVVETLPAPIAPVKPPVRSPTVNGGSNCGKSICGVNEECCNASCGICTPKDGACIQLACIETPPERPVRPPSVSNLLPLAPPHVPAPFVGGKKCGKKICSSTEVCCNDSCGICTEPGVGCIKLFCVDSPSAKPKQVVTPATSKPVAKPINLPPLSFCKDDHECPKPDCLPNSKICPVGKCLNNKCSIVSLPLPGFCNTDNDCPVACSMKADMYGNPVPCTKASCINNKCKNIVPVKELPIKSVPCGKNTCTGGTVCCDPLCGTCTMPDMACTLGCAIKEDHPIAAVDPLY